MILTKMNTVLLASLMTLTSVHAADSALYRWLDEQGRVHFGDRPPASAAAQAESLERPVYRSPGDSPADHPYSIVNQARRMETARRLQLQQRSERESLAHELAIREKELELRERTLASPQMMDAVPRYAVPAYPARPAISWPYRLPNQRYRGLWQADHPAFQPRPAPKRRAPACVPQSAVIE